MVYYLLIVVIFFGAAWLQYLIHGLCADPSAKLLNNSQGSSGFPWWIALRHWVNFFLLILLIRSGLSVLADHPRLYWNNSCKLGPEWSRFLPLSDIIDNLQNFILRITRARFGRGLLDQYGCDRNHRSRGIVNSFK